MDIAEMHVAFRQYAQQMGMQNTRAILPEQIDILLNQSIMDNVNQLIRDNIGVTNDRVITDNSKIGQINALRTLYKVKESPIVFNNSYLKTTTIITTTAEGDITNVQKELVETSEADSDIKVDNVRTIITYTPVNASFLYSPVDRLIGLIKHTNPIPGDEDPVFGNYMFLVDISINYKATTNGDTIITPWYPVRIIDSAYLADSLNDFILKNRFRSPIACVYSQDTLELYIDKFEKAEITPKIKRGGTILVPNNLRIDIIDKPATVRYAADINESEGQDCNLPENMHGDIVKHAVDLYRIALTGSLQAQQEAEQNQQRENVRNNYRNEGN